MSRGLQAKEIATEIGMSYETVRHHKKNLSVKLGAKNGANAVYIGYVQGLL